MKSPFSEDIDYSVNSIIAKMISIAQKSNEKLDTFLVKYFKENNINDVELFKAFLMTKFDLNEHEINKIILYFKNPDNVNQFINNKSVDGNIIKESLNLKESNGFNMNISTQASVDLNKLLNHAKDVPKIMESIQKEKNKEKEKQ